MAAVAEVEVGEEVRLRHVWAAVDAGLVINPDGAANQVEGAHHPGGELGPEGAGAIRDGRVATSTWDDYPILRFSEVPEIDIRLIDGARRARARPRRGRRWDRPLRRSAMRSRARSGHAFAICH